MKNTLQAVFSEQVHSHQCGGHNHRGTLWHIPPPTHRGSVHSGQQSRHHDAAEHCHDSTAGCCENPQRTRQFCIPRTCRMATEYAPTSHNDEPPRKTPKHLCGMVNGAYVVYYPKSDEPTRAPGHGESRQREDIRDEGFVGVEPHNEPAPTRRNHKETPRTPPHEDKVTRHEAQQATNSSGCGKPAARRGATSPCSTCGPAGELDQ